MSKLAILGGSPVRDKYLSYGKQWIDENDINDVVSVLKGDYLTTGPMVEAFEDKVAKYVGSKYAVAVANGTAALHIACMAAGIQKDDEVLVSSITFAASSNGVLYCGGTPIFVDVNENNYNIDVEAIEALITERTKAIVAVDFSGQSVDMDALRVIAQKYNLLIIEDAAHAIGSEYKGRKVGSLGDMTTFSFHPVKTITTGEGGIITTNDDELYKKLLLYRTHGITREDLIDEEKGSWYYEQQTLGFNYRLTDIQCALGLSQMKRIDNFVARRRELVGLYNELFKDYDKIITPFEEEYSNSGWHLYVVRLNLSKISVNRDTIFKALQAENIGVNLHYIPVYLHPYYRELGYEKGLCPVAEKLYDEFVTLPLFPKMSNDDLEDVVRAVKKVVDYYSL